MALKRSEQEVEVIYVAPDGSAFWSPDGEGRFYFESLKEAKENAVFDMPVKKLKEFPEDY
jgi:hypothetical protein